MCSSDLTGGSIAAAVQTFTGNGVQTDFTLSTTPQSIDQILVNINGLLQLPSAYSLSGNVLTTSSAVPNGAVMAVTQYNAQSIVYGTQGTTGAQGTQGATGSGSSYYIANGTSNIAIASSNANATVTIAGKIGRAHV